MNPQINILDKIVESTKVRIDGQKQKISLAKMEQIARADTLNIPFAFEKALSTSKTHSAKNHPMHFICEVKKASPSKGIIAHDFPYKNIALEYENTGASAISCLTEPHFFQGSDTYLCDIKQIVQIPLLRKDFIIDEYMIYQAKAIGADAILLIAAILDREQMRDYFALANELGLSTLFETHDEGDLQKVLDCKARIIGVNNRDLRTFKVDINTTIHLRPLVPKDCIFVSESGIHTKEDIAKLSAHDVDAVLIGEGLMSVEDKRAKLQELQSRI